VRSPGRLGGRPVRGAVGMPALQHFAIRQAEWLPQRMPRLLAAVAACRRLRSLHLVDCALTMEVLRDIRATAHVEVLDLRGNPKLFPGGAGAIVPEAWAQLAVQEPGHQRVRVPGGADSGGAVSGFERLRLYAGAAGPGADRGPGHGRGGCRLLGRDAERHACPPWSGGLSGSTSAFGQRQTWVLSLHLLYFGRH